MNWVYDHTIEHNGKTYHVWVARHSELEAVYQMTHQPDPSTELDYVKPGVRSGFWTSLEAFERYIKATAL